MNIKILGPGCPNCQKLEANTKKALEELKMEAVVEKITEIQKIMEYNVMSMPVLVADENVLSYGIVPSAEEIKKMLMEKTEPTVGKSSGCCSCGGKC